MRFEITQRLRRAARCWALAVAGGWLMVAAPMARAADPVPAELFFKRPAVQALQLSPNGRRLAITSEVKGRTGLFVIDLQASDFVVSAAAIFSDTDVSEFAWVDDERLVFSVVDLRTGSGQDYRAAPGLFAARYDGSELRVLVARFGVPIVFTGVPANPLPWYHQLIRVPIASNEPGGAHADEVIVGEMQFEGTALSGLVPSWLSARTGRTRPLDTDHSPPHAVRWWFSARGRPRALLARHEGRESLHWYQLPRDGQPGRWLQLAEGGLDALPFYPVWVGDDDSMYVQHRAGPAGEMVVAPFDFAQGSPGRARVVIPGFDFDGQVIDDREGRQILGVRVDADAEQTVWFDAAHKAMQARADNAMPGRVNRLVCRRCDADDAVAVVQSWSDRDPGQLLLWRSSGKGGHWSVVSTQQPGIDPKRMGTVDFIRIRARDGHDLPVWITRPADFQPGHPLPAVVMVHGGPWLRNGYWRWDPMAQFLASRGYVVIEPEFRGSDGYGDAHLRAGFKQFGQAMQDDVADALRWAQRENIASGKACIVGGSYGGYSTLMGLIRDPGLYRCGSAWSAIADLTLYLEGGWFVLDDISGVGRKFYLPERVGDPEKDRAMLLANSPVEQAARIKAPLQLIWGDEDRRVPIAHGKRLRSAMQKAGLEPEWVVYEGEAHGLRKTENQVDMALKIEAFLAKHLK